MVLPPRRPSAEMRSIRRQLQRRRPKPLAPKLPATMKPSALPSSREEASGKIPDPSALPRSMNPSSVTSKARSGSASTRAPLPAAPLPQPPSRSVAPSIGSASAAIPVAAVRLRPGTAVRVRTRTSVLLARRTVEIWLWLPATVVSAAADGSYEVVYKGNLPRGDPFATVRIAQDHVVPEKQPPQMPLPSRSASSSACASASNSQADECKNSSIQPRPRPTTAGKSMRLIRKLEAEMEFQCAHGSGGANLPGGDSLATVHVARDGVRTQMLSSITSPPPRDTNSCAFVNTTLAARSRTSKFQSAPPRPTTAGKSLLPLSKLSSEMQATPRLTTAGKSIHVVRKIVSAMEFQTRAMVPGY